MQGLGKLVRFNLAEVCICSDEESSQSRKEAEDSVVRSSTNSDTHTHRHPHQSNDSGGSKSK